MPFEPARLHQTTAGAASHGAASSGIGGTPFGATSAFMHGMHQMQAGRPAVGDAGTPNVNLQLFNRKQSQGSIRRAAPTELYDPSHAPTEVDDSGSDDLSRLEADMAASKKAVAEEERNEKKAAAAAKKNKRPAAAPSVSDPGDKKAAVATPLLKRPAVAKRPAAVLFDFDIDAWRREYYKSKLRQYTREDETLAVRAHNVVHRG